MTDVTLNRDNKIIPESDKVDALERVITGLQNGMFTTVSPSYAQDIKQSIEYCNQLSAKMDIQDMIRPKLNAVSDLLGQAVTGAFNHVAGHQTKSIDKITNAAAHDLCQHLKSHPKLG